MKIIQCTLGSLLCLISLTTFASTNNTVSIKRYALFSASNNGGENRQQLRYAETDAIALSKVFQELGGLSSRNNTLLLSPSKQQLLYALAELKTVIQQNHDTSERVEFIFYYSGHSDETGLLLQDGKVPYSTLHKSINEIGSDVKIAILDSCQSGAFTRFKGGQRIPPFMINAANKVKGNIYLTASSESEASQESDAIGASFFTHYLVSALRGASDFSGDKQVTLNEAYQYAFQETLSNTEKSQGGAQHPAYNIQIAGAGDLVLTDIEKSSATLVVPSELLGRVFIRDRSGTLVAELNKLTNKEISVALSPNTYEILWQKNPEYYSKSVKISSGESKKLPLDTFTVVEQSTTTNRGNSLVSHSLYNDRRNHKSYYVSAGYLYSSNQYTGAYKSTNTPDSCCSKYDDQVSKYTGFQVAAFMETPFSDLYIKYYQLADTAIIRGASIGANYSPLSPFRAQNLSLDFYLGISVFTEKLHDIPEQMYLTIEQHSADFNKSNSGFLFPVGLKAKVNQFVIDLSIHKKIRERYNPESHSEWLPSFSLLLGYQI